MLRNNSRNHEYMQGVSQLTRLPVDYLPCLLLSLVPCCCPVCWFGCWPYRFRRRCVRLNCFCCRPIVVVLVVLVFALVVVVHVFVVVVQWLLPLLLLVLCCPSVRCLTAFAPLLVVVLVVSLLSSLLGSLSFSCLVKSITLGLIGARNR